MQTPISFGDLDELRLAGHAIALQLSYASLQHTKYSGDPNFGGGHIVLWLPSGDVYDPLDDGRRPGIAKAPVRIPRRLLRQAAGELVLNARGKTVGIGKAYAGIFPKRHPANETGGRTTPSAADVRQRGDTHAGGMRSSWAQHSFGRAPEAFPVA